MELENLEWYSLLKNLSEGAQSKQGRQRCLELPQLEPEEVEKSWSQQSALRDLIRTGYTPPIGEIEDLSSTFRAAQLGQILDAEQLRSVSQLLMTVKQLQHFLKNFESRCKPLRHYSQQLYPLPHLLTAIDRSIGPEGEVLDSASDELAKTRRAKLSLRKQIEKNIRQLLTDAQLETYIQDKFFTMRRERYVIPIRLDGRGRVEGSIYDTSDSGQTLFIEPTAIRPLNESLAELELTEKLEIIRIFRELSGSVAEEGEILEGNYSELIELDVLVAKSRLAHLLDSQAVQLVNHPTIWLKNARHPILHISLDEPPVANDIMLEAPEQNTLIVSGPNAGGKTVALKTVGLLQLMAQVGLLLPAAPESKIFLFKKIYLAMGDPQKLEANLSTFSGHLMTLKPILDQADRECLVLLDELAAGTDPQTASAIAQAILENLAEKKVSTIVTTHFDSLKALAVQQKHFRNGSMEFSTKTLKPTYKLILDVPGQSYGLEVAAHLGFPQKVIDRALQLKGNHTEELDSLLQKLSEAREFAEQQAEKLERERLAMETQKFHWQKEKESLQELRAKAGEKINRTYESKISHLKNKLEESYERLQKMIKTAAKVQPEQWDAAKKNLKTERSAIDETIGAIQQSMSELGNNYSPRKEIPGRSCRIDELKPGDQVYILSLERGGQVIKVHEGQNQVEVQAGLLKLRPNILELRLLDQPKQATKAAKKQAPKAKAHHTKVHRGDIPFVPQGQTNTLDLRGLDQERALDRMWDFIDRCLLRGENQVVLIHGHGTDALKRTLRTALAKDNPYNLDFRPGESEEGGDGVTIVQING